MSYISKGAQLIWNKKKSADKDAASLVLNVGDAIDALMTSSWVFPGLQEIGSIAISGAAGNYDQIEVTTLADNRHVYVDGLIAESESGNQITFKFLYEPTLFKAFTAILDHEKSATDIASETSGMNAYTHYVVAIPEGGHFEIEAGIANVTMDTVSVNSALTFSVTLAVRDIEMEEDSFNSLSV